MKRARIIIEFNGRRYRVGNSAMCRKRNCSLFRRGVCDCENDRRRMPCDGLLSAFEDAGLHFPTRCFREVK